MHSHHRRPSRRLGRHSLPALLAVAAATSLAIAVAVAAAPVEAKVSGQAATGRTVARAFGAWSATTQKSHVKRHEGRSVRISARRQSRSIAIVSKPVAAPFAGSSRALIQLRSARPRTRLCVRVERGWKAGTIARSCVTVGRAWRGASVRVPRLAQGQRVRLSIRAGAASRGPLFEIRNARMRFTPARQADVLPCSSQARRSSPACAAPPTPASALPAPPAPVPSPSNPPPAATPSATTAPTPRPPAVTPPSPISCDRVAAANGSDSAAGTVAAPFLTAQRLAGSLAAGQTGCLRGGTYDAGSTYVLDLSTGGIHLRSYPGERARLIGVVHVRSSAAGSRLSNLDFEGDGTMNAIKIYGADVTVEDSDITSAGRGWSCLMLGSNAGAGQATRVIVRRNRFHDCGSTANTNKDHAIYAQNVADGRITGNVFWNSAAYAIQLYPNAQRTVFAHNVIDGDAPSIRGGVVFGGDSSYASSDNVVEQNVIAHSASANITSSWSGRVGTGNVARNNCVWGAAQGEIETANGGFGTSGNLVADPRFRDRSRRDYRLGAASPCLALVGYDAAAMLRQ